MEGRSAFHDYGVAWMRRQHEYRYVIGRIGSPPPLPGLVGPGAADGTEHVSSQDPRADVLEAAGGEVFVGPRGAALLAEHAPESARRERPLVQSPSADAHGILQALRRTRTEAIDRDRERSHADFGHWHLPLSLRASYLAEIGRASCRERV